MTWDAFHRRGEVLRTVTETADTRRDGVLPMDVPGVAETFGDELTLLGALQLRWHTRLSGAIETRLGQEPVDLSEAVQAAWRRTAEELPGTRAVLDAYAAAPTSPEMAAATTRARDKERVLLAAMAGRSSLTDAHSAAAGREIELAAREREPVGPDADRAGQADQADQAERTGAHGGPGQPGQPGQRSDEGSLLTRIKAALAA